jgi:hypothetical protein
MKATYTNLIIVHSQTEFNEVPLQECGVYGKILAVRR